MHCKAHSRVLVRSDGQGLCAPCFERSQSEQAEEGLGGRGEEAAGYFCVFGTAKCKVSLSGQLGERLHVRLDDGAGDRRQRKMEM